MDPKMDTKSAHVHTTQVPDWEHGITTHDTWHSTPTAKRAFTARLDAHLPAHKRYMHLSRTAFLIALLGATLALLILIIGLAAGLTTRASHGPALPLPSNANVFSGELTYFAPGLGACGMVNSAADKIVSVSHVLFDAAGASTVDGGNSNDNPLCNLTLRARRYDEVVGKIRSVDLMVVDRCVGCKEFDLDTTESAFGELAAVASGRVDVMWAWL